LHAAAYDLGIEWAVIKGVADFADGSKSVVTQEWKQFASVMAASVVHNLFIKDHIIEEWPHYKNIDPGMARDKIVAKKPKLEESSNEDEYEGQKESQPASRMCICKLLDLDNVSKEPILSALECFDVLEATIMKNTFEAKGGIGLAKDALLKWGVADGENNVGALKKIVENKMKRTDVLDEIKKWEKLSVCHGCGIKLKIKQSDNTNSQTA
ncbi:5 -methylthioadenosine S-adenosylhomocysteine nucleosidase, partial [Paramuricea clavata]